MNKPELYERTVSILVQSYFNDTLEHGRCTACAVGNICKEPARYLDLEGDEWAAIFYTSYNEQNTAFDGGDTGLMFQGKRNEGLQLIDATGYTPRELAQIEYAFETALYSCDKDEYMFNGLMSVIDALDQIHKNTDSNVTASTKQRFVKL